MDTRGIQVLVNGVKVLMPNHLYCDHDGYVMLHRIVAERALGRIIHKRHPIHHVDGNRYNNSGSNLVVCQDAAYHKLLHQRADALRVCGHADWVKCQYCCEYDSISNLEMKRRGDRPTGVRYFHRSCAQEYHREYEKGRDKTRKHQRRK